MLKILFLLTYLVCLPALARGYEAKYDMLWSVGLKLKAEATETLKKNGDRYQIILDAKASVGSANETTNLLYFPESGWRPLDYSYTQNILGRTKGRHFRFNWNTGMLTWLHQPERNELLIPINALDPLGFRLQLAYLLMNEKDLPNTVNMLDGDDVNARTISVGKLEMLDTPYGKIEAQKFMLMEDNPASERSFEFWLAPSLDYQLVKLKKRDKKRLFALTLKAFKKSGTP